ncbi:MAG: DUF3500 domain-containing protein [Planctomycetaceae bacterium]
MATLLVARSVEEPSSGRAMGEAGEVFLESLSEQQREQATFAFDDPERLNWHFIPRERKGLSLKDLEGGSLAAARQLIASGLSDAGHEQAADVMSLEEVLYLLEGGERQQRRQRRDPQNYFLSIFGTPGTEGTWGWRLEGHHLSLNYVITDGEVVASTPEFFGANPAKIVAGPQRTLRVLGPEEDLARQILRLCNDEQQKAAWIEKTAPDDIRAGGEAQPPQTKPVGLAVATMSDDQKKLMQELLSEYLGNMPRDVSQRRRAQVNDAGVENIHFAWWGGAEVDGPHAYRIQGPTFLIEYNNTQNSANHVHSVWRDTRGDFNVPVE